MRLRQLAFVAYLAAIPACVGEIVDVEGSGDLGMDMPPGDEGGGTPPTGNPTPPPGNQFACRDKVTGNLPSGEHNPGQDCMSNCHDHGFTMGGTLMTTAGAPYVGGVITVVDATGKTLDLTSYRNGNFFTKQAIAFPVKIYASACPDVKPMITEVKQVDAGCNRGGCHGAGGIGPVSL